MKCFLLQAWWESMGRWVDVKRCAVETDARDIGSSVIDDRPSIPFRILKIEGGVTDVVWRRGEPFGDPPKSLAVGGTPPLDGDFEIYRNWANEA